ncbi:MAG: PKD domain-containing protein [Bacteroidia bacterium]|nr:PKD domain-containing protein [Bacteroidia bacterium]
MKKNYKRNWLFKIKSAFVLASFLLSGTAMAQLSGTYTINKGSSASTTNFTSFRSFATAAARGVTGPVTVNVVKGSGPYSEWVQFDNISGTSSTKTITVNGNGNTITHAGSGSRSAVITFNSTDYFTIDNLLINNTGSSYGRCVQIRGGSTYVTVSNCKLNMPNMTSTNTANCYVLLGNGSNYSVYTYQDAASNCVIRNNVTSSGVNKGPYWGIFSAGPRYNASTRFNTFDGNEIKDFYIYGIRTYYEKTGTTITNNKIHRTGHSRYRGAYGIYAYQYYGGGSFNISNNKIFNLGRNTSTNYKYGIYFYGYRAYGSTNTLISNNVIDLGGAGGIYGIYAYTYYAQAGANIYHNTISLTKDAGINNTSYVYALYTYYMAGNVKNNIIYSNLNKTAGMLRTIYGFARAPYGPATFDNNNIHIEDVTGGGSKYYAYYNNTQYDTYDDLVKGFGTNWMNKSVSFVDRNTQNYAVASFGLCNKGVPVGISSDVDGNSRSKTKPDIGAVEFVLDLSNTALNFKTGATECGGYSDSVRLTIKNENSFPLSNIPIAFNINGGKAVTETVAGPIAGGASINYTFNNLPMFTKPGKNTLSAFIAEEDDDSSNDSTSYSFDIQSSPTGGALSQSTTFEGYFEAGTELDPDVIAAPYTNEYDISRPNKYSTSGPGADYTYALKVTDQNSIDVTAAGFSYTNLAESFTVSPKDSLSGRTLDVALVVSDANTGCDTTISRTMYVPHVPVPSFNSSDICLGDVAQFKNTSTLKGSGYMLTNWEFNDPDPTVTDDNSDIKDGFWKYTTYGSDVYVKMTVSNGVYPKFQYVDVDTIVVTPKPVVDFKVLNACEGSPITVKNNTTLPVTSKITYAWDFAGEYTTSDVDPSYTFTSPGQRKISVTATANGCFASLTKNAYQFEMPTAGFTSEGECNFVNVDFKNSSTIENGANMGYAWDFAGEGISREQNPAFAFGTPGTKTVTLTATSEFGCVNVFTKDIVLQESPEADFTWDAACNLTPINFTITGSLPNGGANSSYDWDFAGEADATRADPSHLFSKVGPKIVRLTISDLNGCSSSTVKEVNVVLQAVADFEAGSICEGEEAVFTNKSTVAAGDLTYEWTFGDGATSSDLSPTHLYTESKSFNVKLKAIVDGGCSDEVTYPIVVNPSPDVTFTLTKDGRTVVCDGPAGNDLYRWTFGDGSKDDSEDPTYTFENVDQGTFTVCLATKKGECWNDDCEDITINLAGIENLTQNDDMINVYPNPTTGKFNVTVENAGEVVVKVGDILGNVLDVNVTDNLNGTYSVDLSVVADGVYFVQVKNGDYFATKRITVSK